MTGRSIDLNADLGESFGVWQHGDDRALLGLVTSANLACGFHAGDPLTMRRSCEAAVENGVSIGAHPAFRDLVGFGRREFAVDPDELADEVVYQVGALQAIAARVGGRVRYVKPHGALYHVLMRDAERAGAVATALAELDPDLAIVTMPTGELREAAARAGLRAIGEVFADRAYLPDGGLVPRSQPGSVLTDADEVVARVLRFAVTGRMPTVDGGEVAIEAETICLHGDTPGAVEHARAVRAAIEGIGVALAPFA